MLEIRPFVPADQAGVKALILQGLAGHWGVIDSALNPDLDDIAAAYAGADFLVARRATVARLDGVIAGCGALVPRDARTGEIVRMSVAAAHRRAGLGSRILDALVERARARGLERLVLETTASWDGVRRFYERYGFVYTHFVEDAFGGQAHYELGLGEDGERR